MSPNSLLPLEFEPGINLLFEPIPIPKAIELDPEAGLIAFRAAERDLSARGFAGMDDMCDLPEHTL